MREPIFNLVHGDVPLLVSIPHMGTSLPEEFRENMTDAVAGLPDTDWHLDRLYDFASGMGASVLSARLSRYVIDLNRSPDGVSLYPGQTTTGLCPLETFHGEAIYREGMVPAQEEIYRRIQTYWRPYHEALAQQIDVIRNRHGFVMLWDAHSINSNLPRLFEGKLPAFNFGTNDGRSCGLAVQEAVVGLAQTAPYSWVLNGRFKGGYITRHYGAPSERVHAVQLELGQEVYMEEEAPYRYRPDRADKTKPVLKALLESALNAAAKAA